jgi:hypothetical protein
VSDTAVRQYLLAFDIHYPEYDPAAWACVLDYARRNRVEGFIFGGDALDLSCVSHHTAGKGLYRPQGALKSNLDGFKRDILDPLDAALNPDADKRFIIGNHEAWLTEQLAETSPELDGMLDLATYLDLERRGYQVIQQGGFTKLGKLVVIHGDTIRAGVYSARKAAEVYAGSSVCMGHYHTLQTHTRSSPVTETDRWTATVLPCLCNLAPRYGRNAANAWLTGFGVCFVRPGGKFNLYPVAVVDGECVGPDGRVYGKRIRKAA